METSCLAKLESNHDILPLAYFRYVHDTFLIVKKVDVDVILTTFNVYHQSLQFTCEIENDKKLNFLDVTLVRNKDKIISNWYQKSSSSNRIMNYYSNHPIHMKSNIIYNLEDRSTLLADKNFHAENLKIVKKLLIINEYPPEFIDRCIKFRIRKINMFLIYCLEKQEQDNLQIKTLFLFPSLKSFSGNA